MPIPEMSPILTNSPATLLVQNEAAICPSAMSVIPMMVVVLDPHHRARRIMNRPKATPQARFKEPTKDTVEAGTFDNEDESSAI
jgi:hypothetical protein